MDLLVGLDAGTTHVKAGAFGLDGRPVASFSVPTPTTRLPDGGAEHDPEALWAAASECLARVAAAVRSRVVGIGVASMAEAGLLVDAAGRPATPLLAWFDQRPAAQAAGLARDPGLAWLHARTGLILAPKHGLPKLLWLRERRPELFQGGHRWLGAAEYLVLRLTGKLASCPTLAARTLLYDLEGRGWSAETLDRLGLPANLMPPLVAEGSAVGALTAGGPGLTAGTPVALGGHDHPCAALGVGLTGPGSLLVSTGTAEAVLGAIEHPLLTRAALAAGIGQGPLPVPRLLALQAGASASGGSLEWLRRELLTGETLEGLSELAASTGDGPTGLLFLPHLFGSAPPAPEADATGALVGLRAGTTRAEVVKAVLEGTAFELRRMVEGMESLLGSRFERLTVTGGHARSRVWLQVKADVLGRPLRVPEIPDATLLGAALLGGVAAGVFAGAREASVAAERPPLEVEPRSDSARRYEERFTAYERLSAAVRSAGVDGGLRSAGVDGGGSPAASAAAGPA